MCAIVDFHLQNLSVSCCQNGRVSCNALGVTREVDSVCKIKHSKLPEHVSDADPFKII